MGGRAGGSPVAAVGALVLARARGSEAEAGGEQERSEEHAFVQQLDAVNSATCVVVAVTAVGVNTGHERMLIGLMACDNGLCRSVCYTSYSKPIHALHRAGWPETTWVGQCN